MDTYVSSLGSDAKNSESTVSFPHETCRSSAGMAAECGCRCSPEQRYCMAVNEHRRRRPRGSKAAQVLSKCRRRRAASRSRSISPSSPVASGKRKEEAALVLHSMVSLSSAFRTRSEPATPPPPHIDSDLARLLYCYLSQRPPSATGFKS